MNPKMRRWLYRSLDGALSGKKQITLQTAIQNDPDIQQEQNMIINLRQEMANIAYGPFQTDFSRQVIGKILCLPRQESVLGDLFYESLMSGFRRLAWVGALAIIVLTILNLGFGDALNPENAWILSDFSIQEISNLSLF